MSDDPGFASEFRDARRKRPQLIVVAGVCLLGCGAAVVGYFMIGVERSSDPVESAGSGRGPDTVKVLVAKKDLPVQTKLDSKELNDLLTWADMPRNLVPPDAVVNLEDVKDKELNRTLKTGHPVAYSDLGAGCTSAIPEGLKQMTFRSSQVDAVAGFVRAGSKVDVMYVERTPSGKVRAGIILKNMLVLAVNMIDRVGGDGAAIPIPGVESVTLAVTDKQAIMVAQAEDRGKLKLVLQGNDKKSNTMIAKPAGVNEIEWFDYELDKPFDKSARETPAVTPPQPTGTLDTAVVARKPVPVNLLINADNVHTYFETIRLENIPNGVIQNPDDLKGKYIIKALDKGQYIYKTLIGNDPVFPKKN
jgi:pilus assembly protein CpaB